MSKNNKSLASQALLEMEDIKKAIKEESKNTLKTILSEVVKDALRESIDDEEEKEYEVVDEENDAKTDNDEKDEESKEEGNIEEDDDQDLQNADPDAQEAPVTDPNAMGDEPVADGETGAEEAPEDNMDSEGEGEDEWSEFQQYQSGDNTYDLTGVNDPGTVLKAYKLLKDDDQVVVKKEGSMINIQDNETGNEYMIDLGDAEEGGEEAPEGEEEMSGINEGFDSDGDEFIFNDEEGDELEPVNYEEDYDEFEGEPEGELGPNGEEPAGFNDMGEKEEFNNRFEGKKSRKTMKENKSKKNELLFEIDLGYTDNYQSKDPIQGLSNSEPSKSGKSWEKGVPTGTEKPWAGETKSKGDPFKKTEKVQGSVNEEDITDAPDSVEDMPVDEQMNVGGFVQDNTTATSRKPNNPTHRNARSERGSNFTPSTEAPYKGVNESLMKIKKENKILKEAVKELRKNLNEAYLTNVNLGKITKLFLENAVSQEEKVNIINRFVNEAKTVDQSKQLFESISKDLQKVTKASLSESRLTAEGSKKLNENTIYKSQDLQATLDFIKRMENL